MCKPKQAERNERKMKDAPYEILMTIGGIIAAAMIMLFAIGKINSAKEPSSQADEIVNSMTDSLVNDKYLTFDGATVKGSDVLSFIQTSKSDTICIQVVNGSNTTEYIRKLSDLSQKADGVLAKAKDKANIATVYIDPSVDYIGEVLYLNNDASQSIIGVKFTRN